MAPPYRVGCYQYKNQRGSGTNGEFSDAVIDTIVGLVVVATPLFRKLRAHSLW